MSPIAQPQTAAPEAVPTPNLRHLPVSRVFIGHSYRTRDEVDPDLVLAVQSGRATQPILVRPAPHPEGGEGYEVVYGRRRFLAHRAAGVESILALVEPMDDDAAREQEVAENMQRKAFSPPELARAVLDIVRRKAGWEQVRRFERPEHGADPDKITAAVFWRLRNHCEGKAERLEELRRESPLADSILRVLEQFGLSFSYFTGSVLPSLDWPAEVQEAVASGLSAKAARVVAGIEDELVRGQVLKAALAAKAEGKSAEAAAREAREQAFQALKHHLQVDRLERENEEHRRSAVGWRYPQAREGEDFAPLAVGSSHTGWVYDRLGVGDVEINPLFIEHLVSRYSEVGQKVAFWGTGLSTAIDLALESGRAVWGCDPLGLAEYLDPAPMWQADPGTPVDLAIVVFPPCGSKLSEFYCDAPREGDISRAEPAAYLAAVRATCEKVTQCLDKGGRIVAVLPVQNVEGTGPLPVETMVLAAADGLRPLERLVAVSVDDYDDLAYSVYVLRKD